MNTWQCCRQLQDLLLKATWPDGLAEPVFGAVRITSAPVELALGQYVPPVTLIRVASATPDVQEPGLSLQLLDVALVVQVTGDALGQAALVGGPRQAGQGGSGGRGLLEVEEELKRAVAKLTGANGVRVRSRASSRALAAQDETHGYVVFRTYTFEALLADDRDYPRPENLVAAPQGGGNVDLTWTLQPDRFDRFEVILRRAAGGVPPATPTAGVGVPLSGPLATSVTDSPTPGTFSYALFAGYDESSSVPAVSDRFSPSVARAGVVVT